MHRREGISFRDLIVCLLLACLLLGGPEVLAQKSTNIRMTERFDKTPLSYILLLLRDKYDLRLAYDLASIENVYVSQNLENVELSEALELIFDDTPITYQLVGGQQVLLRRKEQTVKGFNLRGQVLDEEGNPLAFATIVLKPQQKGLVANELGYFEYFVEDAAERPQQLEVRYLGYLSKQLILDGREKLLDIRLKAEPQEISHVTITDRLPLTRQTRDGRVTRLQADRLQNLPSLMGSFDPFRTLMLLPGISAHDDLSADLKVRGGKGDENRIIVDGIPLYNVDHFYGLFTMINGSMVEEIDIYKNAFPAEFGGRLSSVVDITTLGVGPKKVEGGLEVNLLTSTANLQLPLNEKMGLSIGGRMTNSNLTDSGILPYEDPEITLPTLSDDRDADKKQSTVQLNPDFKFYDLNAKWHWQISPKTRAEASYFRGMDTYGHFYELDFERVRPKVIQVMPLRRVRDTLDIYFWDREDAQWENEGLSFRLDHIWNESFSSSISLARSQYQLDFNKVVGREETSDRFPRDNSEVVLREERSNSIEGLHLTSRNEYHSPEGHLLAFGYQWVHSDVSSLLLADGTSLFEQNLTADQHAIFAEMSPDWHKDIDFTIGIRTTYDKLTDKIYQSPRLQLAYQLDQHLSFKGSWARYNQFVREIQYEDRFGKNFDYWVASDDEEYPVSSARQWMVGFRFLKKKWKLDVEFYRRDTEGIVEQAKEFNAPTEETPADSLSFRVFEGSGKTLGMDVLLEKSSGNYTGWIAYTLSKSTVSYPDIFDGKEYPSVDDRRHQLKWINQYQWNKWYFSASYIFSKGGAYTNLSLLIDTGRDRAAIKPRERISYLDDYHRFDIGVDYRFDWGKSKWHIGLSVLNLFNRVNLKYEQNYFVNSDLKNDNQELRTVLGTEVQLLERTPNLTVGIRF